MPDITIFDNLRAVNAYPIPYDVISGACIAHSLDMDEVMTVASYTPAYKAAKADLLQWLSGAPDVSQGGQSYSFTDEQRTQLRRDARALYDESGEAVGSKAVFGYKGSRF